MEGSRAGSCGRAAALGAQLQLLPRDHGKGQEEPGARPRGVARGEGKGKSGKGGDGEGREREKQLKVKDEEGEKAKEGDLKGKRRKQQREGRTIREGK